MKIRNFLICFRKFDRKRDTRHSPPEPVAKSGQTLRKNSQKKFTEKIQNLMREITKISSTAQRNFSNVDTSQRVLSQLLFEPIPAV